MIKQLNQGSVLAPALFSHYVSSKLQTLSIGRAVLSASCSAVSFHWRRGVSAGTQWTSDSGHLFPSWIQYRFTIVCRSDQVRLFVCWSCGCEDADWQYINIYFVWISRDVECRALDSLHILTVISCTDQFHVFHVMDHEVRVTLYCWPLCRYSQAVKLRWICFFLLSDC